MASRSQKKLSFYPLKFEEAISDVLKVKPEPKLGKPKQESPRKKLLGEGQTTRFGKTKLPKPKRDPAPRGLTPRKPKLQK